jgi:hypothetical protein
VEEPLDGHIHGVARPPGDDPLAKRVRQARAAGPACNVILDGGHAGQRIADRAVTGAPAQVTLEGTRQVRPLLLIERGRRHPGCGSAESSLPLTL